MGRRPLRTRRWVRAALAGLAPIALGVALILHGSSLQSDATQNPDLPRSLKSVDVDSQAGYVVTLLGIAFCCVGIVVGAAVHQRRR